LLVGQLVQANELLKAELATKQAQLVSDENQVSTLQATIQDLRERWLGSPAIYQAPPISNTTIKYFAVSGTSQQELENSLDSADLCTKYSPCLKDPLNPGGIAWGLEWFAPASSYYVCRSPRTTYVPYREFVVLPRWSPPADGSIKIPLVEKWNALAKAIYTHEAGHAAIDKTSLAALNAQAQRQSTCSALARFWANPHVFDKNASDQLAYHARLYADCRPEIGCVPAGWLGW